jgi:transposase, IS6 family
VSNFKGRHFGGEIVLWAVRWYCRYGISYRDLEQMMAERGVSVDHSTIYRWVQRYAPEIEKRLRWHWRRPRSGSWRVDETYVTEPSTSWATRLISISPRRGTRWRQSVSWPRPSGV